MAFADLLYSSASGAAFIVDDEGHHTVAQALLEHQESPSPAIREEE